MRANLADVVADVLDEHDVDAARVLLAESILAATGTEMGTRVRVQRHRSEAIMRIHGHGFRPAAEQLPGAAEIREHPLYRYRMHTGDERPTRLEDVLRGGWTLSTRTRHLIEALQITVHQVAFPVSSLGEYDGWSLLAPEPIGRLQLRPLVEHARLLRGLDAHVELLARIRERSPAQPDAGAPLLTPRERGVLHLMYAGGTAVSIGARLGVSPRTVHKHQENLYRKLGARDRLEAVLIAQRAGLLPTHPDEAEAVPTRASGLRRD
ncbi:helix-turn-helix transcriptional regulator [Agrococcus beijingensis]|uniref:helix-turn-helix transcriptional regulator n=1 Tax=Agrococcus beijingensis TaxID=3068634 RepID=UPI002742672B|nr:LuxR C-terminal-related transcriptional regulator [Agrococcus sp. REN33]